MQETMRCVSSKKACYADASFKPLEKRFPTTGQPIQMDIDIRAETIHCYQAYITSEVAGILYTKQQSVVNVCYT